MKAVIIARNRGDRWTPEYRAKLTVYEGKRAMAVAYARSIGIAYDMARALVGDDNIQGGIGKGPAIKRVAAMLAILSAFALPPTQGASAATPVYKEHIIWMTLPSRGDSTTNCNRSGPPITELQILEASATSFNPLDTDTIGGVFPIYGMEGDSAGVVWDIRPGVMGSMRYRVRNPQGWSCWVEYVFAVPAQEDMIPPPEPQDSVLTAQYYDNEDFTGLYATLQDSMINYVWYSDPPLAGMGADSFSVRWTGGLTAPETGTYRICNEICNGGYRLWLAGSLFSSLDAPTTCEELCTVVGLTAGDRYDVKLEYWNLVGTARDRMRWITPSWVDEIIPASAWRGTP